MRSRVGLCDEEQGGVSSCLLCESSVDPPLSWTWGPLRAEHQSIKRGGVLCSQATECLAQQEHQVALFSTNN